MADFLFEIGLEEVPARMIPGAEAELLRHTLAMLGREGLLEDRVSLESGAPASYSTPRRLAVLVRGVHVQQADISEEVTGPAVKIALKDGVPGPAAEAFARKNGIAVSELKKITTPKGEYLAATVVKKGRSAAEVIAEEMPKELAAIYWAKNMRWIPGSNDKFVRPVMWMVCLLDEAVVPVSFAGKTAGRVSMGHRVLSSGEAFEVEIPASYLAQLEGEYVLADVEVRRQKIRKALDRVTRTVPGARWREDEAMVDAVTHLTEWPDVLLGGFEDAYLELPEEVLVTVMRDHQKYFAVESADGKLAAHFLTVTNIELNETNAPVIRQGNERVLRARFNDARFFWEFDQRTPLAERVKLLENVTFQKDLGSYAAKSERVRVLALKLAAVVAGPMSQKRDMGHPDVAALEEAARLAKTDLTTELVKEFTELQGIIGGLYARAQSLSPASADAIHDQYLPASADDAIPRSAEGALLGLADRMDTLAGMFGLGMEPTGSKDPFALRRAANAVVRIMAEAGLPLRLSDVLGASDASESTVTRLRLFFEERFAFYLREVRGHAYDVVNAVMLSGADDLRDAVARAEAVTAVRGGADFLAVSAAFKRMKNILQQAVDGDMSIGGNVADDPHPATQKLHASATEASFAYSNLSSDKRYLEAINVLASLRGPIDEFFDQTMVMDLNLDVRAVRLGLLGEMLNTFSYIADFSEIVATS